MKDVRLVPQRGELERVSGSGRLAISVIQPHALTEAHLAAWRHIQKTDPALESPYLCPEFTQIAAAIRTGVSVAIAESDGGSVGFFPFERRGSIGKPVGGALSDCQAVLADSEWAWDPLTFLRAAGLSVYDFTNLRASQRPFAPFHRSSSISPVIDMSEGFEAYVCERRESAKHLSGATSGFPHQTIARMRRLERQIGPMRFTMHDPDPAVLRLLLAWKSQQYRRTGSQDVFARRWTVDLLERIHATQTGPFSGVLSTLSIGDRVIAAHMGMRSQTVLHWWFPAYDREFSKFSPGLMLLLEICRLATAQGVRTIELGAGEEAYKPLVANGGIPVAAGFVGSASLPLLRRNLLHKTKATAARLSPGRFEPWVGKILRRIERIDRLR